MKSPVRSILLAMLATSTLVVSAEAAPHGMNLQPVSLPSQSRSWQPYNPNSPKPDLAVVALSANPVAVSSPLSAKVGVVATLKNLGSVSFKHPGAKLVLYRGTDILSVKPVNTMAAGATMVVQHQIDETYHPQYGAAYHPNYVAKIVYDPKTLVLSFSQIDGNFLNNIRLVSQTPIAAGLKGTSGTNYGQSLLNLINQYRAGSGRKALLLESGMSQSAQAHSKWMASTGKFQHASSAGWETIFMGSSAPLDCFNAWKKSPPHNAIMLQPSLSKIGIGIANGYVTAQYK